MKKRKDGLYASQVYLGMEDGKRKYKTVYGKTQKEAKEKAAEIKIKIGKGIDVSAEGEFEIWGRRYLDIKHGENLTAAYLTALEARFKHLRGLYAIPIAKITLAYIQDVINSLASWDAGRAPLARRTIGSIRELAASIFDYAIVSRAIDFNPAKYVVLPKNATSKTRKAISAEQRQWIIDTPHRAQRAAMIMLYSGLRRGELVALTWADINLEDGYIDVNKAVEYVKGRPKIKSTKTNAGIRKVSIPSILVDFLNAERQKDGCLYVVHTVKGNMFTSTGWKRMWESYMHELNIKYGYDYSVHKNSPSKINMRIEPFTSHQLRHTFASMLYLAGTDVLVAKEQMGHQNIETTLGIYTHLDKEHKKASVNKLNEYLCKYDASNDV